jgi:AcrR family transcriptional regulator
MAATATAAANGSARRRLPSLPDQRGLNRSTRELDRAQLANIQRTRILAGAFDVVRELGAANTNIVDIVSRSGVSRRTFYEAFSDREDCLLAAFEQALEDASRRVVAAYESKDRWREQVRAGLAALLAYMDEQPAAAHLLIADSLALGGRVLQRREQVVAQLAHALDAGRAQSKWGEDLPPLTAEGAVGGVLSILAQLAGRPHVETTSNLLNPLTAMLVMPYLGPVAARRELDRPVESTLAGTHSAESLADPFKPAGMRLTYRTVRVLLAVAANPNTSNRTLGEAADIRDQGQISKLLGRLRRIGLIENAGLPPSQGAPNAWVLTPAGEQLTSSLRAHAELIAPEDRAEQ